MSETNGERSDANDAYWRIIAGLAADDEFVRDTIGQLIVYDPEGEESVDDCFANLGGYLLGRYGLKEEWHDEVYNQVENTLLTNEVAIYVDA